MCIIFIQTHQLTRQCLLFQISQIQGLRSQVDNLQRSAEEATKVIEGIVQSDNDIAVTIENLQNVRVEQDARICDIQKRVKSDCYI